MLLMHFWRPDSLTRGIIKKAVPYKGATRVSQGCSKGVPRVSKRCFKAVSWVF